MAYRKEVFSIGQYYHLYNRGIAKQPIFFSRKDYQRAIELIIYYSYRNPSLRFSHYKRLPKEEKEKYLQNLKKSSKNQTNILAFCFMPNHYHFVIQEIVEKGLSIFLSKFQNSYAKYINTKYERTGSLFQSMFKAVRIESEEQLIHVCRYVHLNPITSYLLKNDRDLETYKWASFMDCLGKRSGIIDTQHLLRFYPSVEELKSFTYNQADYQRSLEELRYFSLE
ncbi:MAG: transposase [Patescibacteria group bacterium]|nr:transposase [Patescibacteria group bacterium]